MKKEIKYRRFVEKYLSNGLNATEAFLHINPNVTEKSAAELGSRLLRNVKVQELIKFKQEQLAKECTITKEELLNDLKDIKNNNKYEDPKVTLKAIELLNKMYGYFAAEKQEVTHKGEQPLFGELPPKPNNPDLLKD